MTARGPEVASAAEAEGLPDTEDLSPGAVATGDGQDLTLIPADRPAGVDRFGTTPAEEARGASLDARLAEEEPDVLAQADRPWSEDSQVPVGRLVADDEGARADDTAEVVATSVGVDRGGFSAEEAAMHLEPES